jgi:argininosuccinate lyase
MLLGILEFVSKEQDKIIKRLDKVEESIEKDSERNEDFFEMVRGHIGEYVDNEICDYASQMDVQSKAQEIFEYKAGNEIDNIIDNNIKKNLTSQDTTFKFHSLSMRLAQLTEDGLIKIRYKFFNCEPTGSGSAYMKHRQIITGINTLLGMEFLLDNIMDTEAFIFEMKTITNEFKFLLQNGEK